MKHQNHFHCQDCGSHFELEIDLKHHATLCHAPESVSGVVPGEYPPPAEKEEPTRKNKTFTRSHRE